MDGFFYRARVLQISRVKKASIPRCKWVIPAQIDLAVTLTILDFFSI